MDDPVRKLSDVVDAIDALPDSEALSDDAIREYHRLQRVLKSKASGDRDRFDIGEFEYGWGAQTIQFAIDVVPHLHRVLLKHYKRADDLELIDVGCGTGAAAALFAKLHSRRMIWSRMRITAIDKLGGRERWIKLNYPEVSFAIRDIYEVSEKYDIVFCSHCIEHVPGVEEFVAQLVAICRGFCFVYAPYNELDRIPGHRNKITKQLFKPYRARCHIFRSMGWHPARPKDRCILAVIDCR